MPPRIHMFLANGKLLTRDNLNKCRHLDDLTCLFCDEHESSAHLFFKCVVAKILWLSYQLFFGDKLVIFEYVARWWISEDNNYVMNILSSLIFWTLWSTSNDVCLQDKSWLGVKGMLGKLGVLIQSWKIL
jgi:hypothetical protein